MLESLAAWLAATPLNAFVAGEAWVIPTVQTLHILAVAIVMGAAVIVNLRVMDVVETRQSIDRLLARFALPSIVAIGVLAATGLVLIAGEPNRAIFRYVFWAKMALLTLAIALTLGLVAGLKAGGVAAAPGGSAPVALKGLSVLTLAIWGTVIVAGRWIGYAQGWPGSPQ